ncbi:MAG: hypothetical protein ACLR8Y_11470 [Alistipes indistinctus]
MMVLTNTNKGHQASLTVQLTKQFSNGLSGMIAYTYNNAKDLTANPGSVALSAWRSSASVGSLNDPGVSYSAFLDAAPCKRLYLLFGRLGQEPPAFDLHALL